MKKLFSIIIVAAGLFTLCNCNNEELDEIAERETKTQTRADASKTTCRFQAFFPSELDVISSTDFYAVPGESHSLHNGRMVLVYTDRDLSNGVSDLHDFFMGDSEDIQMHLTSIDYTKAWENGKLTLGYNGSLIYALNDSDIINNFSKTDPDSITIKPSRLSFLTNPLNNDTGWLIACFYNMNMSVDIKIVVAMKYHCVDPYPPTDENRPFFGTTPSLDPYTEHWTKVLYDYRYPEDYKTTSQTKL